MTATCLRNARLFDGREARPGRWDVSIGEDGRFAAVTPHDPTSADRAPAVFDAEGAFLLPGLIDLHVHLSWDGGPDPAGALERDRFERTLLVTAASAMRYPAAGVTTVRDLGSPGDAAVHVSRAVAAGLIPGPRIVAAGQSIIMTGGHDPFHGIMVDGPWEALRAVRRQAFAGAGVIKISATGGVYGRSSGEGVEDEELRPEEIAMIVDEAHRRHLRVTAHAIGRQGIANCVEAGIDCIEHGHFVDPALAARMQEKGTALVPTLFVYRLLAGRDDIPAYARDKARAVVDRHAAALKAAVNAGLTVGAGSDAGSPRTPHPSLVEEIRALHAAGLSTAAALRAATADAGAILGRSGQLGVVAPGTAADCILVAGNPLEDLEALRLVTRVFQAGRCVFMA